MRKTDFAWASIAGADAGPDLDAIQKYCDAATEGPWRSLCDGNQYIETGYIPTAKCVATSRIEQIPRPWNPHAVIQFKKFDDAHISRFLEADADFIAGARTDLPALVRECRELRARLEAAERDKERLDWLEKQVKGGVWEWVRWVWPLRSFLGCNAGVKGASPTYREAIDDARLSKSKEDDNV